MNKAELEERNNVLESRNYSLMTEASQKNGVVEGLRKTNHELRNENTTFTAKLEVITNELMWLRGVVEGKVKAKSDKPFFFPGLDHPVCGFFQGGHNTSGKCMTCGKQQWEH